jgi:hypothetical protein
MHPPDRSCRVILSNHDRLLSNCSAEKGLPCLGWTNNAQLQRQLSVIAHRSNGCDLNIDYRVCNILLMPDTAQAT